MSCCHTSGAATKSGQKNGVVEVDEELFSDDEDDENAPTIFEKDHKTRVSENGVQNGGGFLHFMR